MIHNSSIFYRSSCQDIEFNDYLLLGGGTDIAASLYNEPASQYNQSPNVRRDIQNYKQIEHYIEMGKPIIGICRGLQILAAFHGGKLSQHGSHPQSTNIFRNNNYVSSMLNPPAMGPVRECHHQSVIEAGADGLDLYNSSYKWKDEHTGKIYHTNMEIIYWPKTKCFGVQFHPEWHTVNHEVNKWMASFIKQEFGLTNVL